MKALILLVLMVIAVTLLPAQEQDQGPIPKISLQITNYFSYYPQEKVFLVTDKSEYKPGEAIWFRAFVADAENRPASEEGSKLSIGLYDKAGALLLKNSYDLTKGEASGTLIVPDNVQSDTYFLGAYTSSLYSPDQVSVVRLKIDQQYNNQWVVEAIAKDSVSVAEKSNELFVVLRDITGNILKNEYLRYKLKNGPEVLATDKIKTDDNGKVTIPLTIPAKTNGEPFICELSDLKDEWKHEIFLPTSVDPLVVRFYPEGGNLVAGIPTRIGFSVFNKWGIPVDVEGSVVNQDGSPVTPVKTLTKGLGLFSVLNTGQQKLKLQLTGTTGQGQSFELPAPSSNGLAIAVVKTDADFIYANLIFQDKQKHNISLIITHGNSVYWAGDMEINGTGRIKLPANQLPHGINLLSVFSKEGNLLAERLVFKDNKLALKINVAPEKTKLQPKGKMLVKVQLTDENNQPVSGNVCVSVADKFNEAVNQVSIDDYMQLESEVETPFSSFPEAFKQKETNNALLDVFLIANKLKGFDWARIRQFKPENATGTHMENFSVSGVVTDKSGNKMNKAKVSLANNKNMQIYSTITNSEGIFSFPNLSMSNIDDFSVKATDADGKRELKVNLIKDLPGQISVYVFNSIQKHILQNKDFCADKQYIANNPDLFPKAPKKVRTSTSNLDNQRNQLNSSTNILDVIKSIKPFKLASNQIVFFGSENSLNYQGGALIVIDGQQMGTDVGVIQGLSPSDVDHINVSTNPMDIQRYTGLNSVGIVEIFLKGGLAKGANTMKTEGLDGNNHIPGSFPETKEKINRETGTTLFWKPDQKVDQSGKFEFEVGAGKVISDFIIEVQGTTSDGRVGIGKASFSVAK